MGMGRSARLHTSMLLGHAVVTPVTVGGRLCRLRALPAHSALSRIEYKAAAT